MEKSFGLFPILNVVGVAHALLLTTALVCLRRGNRAAHLLLAALMLVISVLLLGGVLTNTKAVLSYPHLAQVHIPFQFLAGPLFFFYIKALISGKGEFRKRDLLHLLPFALCGLYLTPFYFTGAQQKISYLTAALANFPADWLLRTAVGFTLQIIYLAASFLVLKRYQKTISPRESRIYRGDLLLARSLLIAFGVVWFVGVGRFLFAYRLETNLIVPLALSLTTYLVGFLGLVRPQVFAAAEPPAKPSKRYEKSTLTPERAEKYVNRLYRCMQAEKPYCDGDLTLQKLAQKLSISPQHLSQIINERLQQNFIDFINSYRVEEAKRRLTDPGKRHYSIIAIAEESGFNSKSAFNTAFKKYAHRTPSQFRQDYTPARASARSF